MKSQNFLGIRDETTEYLDEFRRHAIPRDTKEVVCDDKTFPKKTTIQTPTFSTSYDTLQKLDFANRLPFDALWPDEPKTVGLNYRVPFCIPTSPKKQPRSSSRNKPLALANPAVDVDRVEDSELRKIVLDYTYKTSKSQDAEEVWRNWIKTNRQSSTPICDDSVKLITPEFKLFPDLPAGFKAAAKKWDSLQDRTVIDDAVPQRRVGETKKSNETVHDREKIDVLNSERKSCADEELEPSDGGQGTYFADEIGLETENVSISDPDLRVSQASDMKTSEEA